MKIRYSNINEKYISQKLWEENFDDNEEQVKFYFENIFNHNNHLVLEENNKIKSSLHENPYIFNFNKIKYQSKYIVGVSTDIKERNKGCMKKLIIGMLKNLKVKNYPFVFLNPINPTLYRKYGFEYFSLLEEYNFNLERLEEIKSPEIETTKIIEITNKNYGKFLEDLILIYNFSMKDKFIHLERDKYYFKKLLSEIFVDNMKVFILYKNNRASSYIIFVFNEELIKVRECFSKDMISKKKILYFLSAYEDKYKRVSITTEENSNLELIFKNQLCIEKKLSPFMMLRIISPIILLENYREIFRGFKLYIEDDILEVNEGIYIFNEDTSQKIKFSKENIVYDLKITIGDLSQLLTGFLSLKDLIKYDKIFISSEINPKKLEALKKYFIKKNSYLYEMI